ncbi:hypothetical protein [Chryseobacterium sp. MEBOG07]|nr:hypothetical protein [Chryseobacterium sp. MEBOG07]UKB78466.1 hypothetical protein LF886_18605 [Chryseobacterium sp. MEBOG07]
MDIHRRNLLQKFQTKNSTEFINWPLQQQMI